MSGKIQHVFLITDGPRCDVVMSNGGAAETLTAPVMLQQQLAHYCQTGEKVVFRVMSGLLCLDVVDQCDRLEVEPLLITPIPMVVTIERLLREPDDPLGVGLLVRVQEMKDYRNHLASTRHEIPVIECGDRMYLSYHLLQSTGGACKIIEDAPMRSHEVMIRSRNDLQREFIAANQPGQRGRSVYKVAGDVEEIPPYNDPSEYYANLHPKLIKLF